MTIEKIATLSGASLRWAVAQAAGLLDGKGNGIRILAQVFIRDENGGLVLWRPDEQWSQGGPIIETEGIALYQYRDVVSSLYEYNDKRWADLTRYGKKVEIVSRPLTVGPSRGIRETKKPGKYHRMWMASYSPSPFGWKASRDFISATPLLAAMRCYVAAKTGAKEIHVPDSIGGQHDSR